MKITHRTFRGDSPQLYRPMLDRRASFRGEVRSPEALLNWSSGQSYDTIEARIVNLSQGGAGLLVHKPPPPDALLRLILTGAGGAVVEGWTVAIREDQAEGWAFLHMKFSHDCPRSALERLLEATWSEAEWPEKD